MARTFWPNPSLCGMHLPGPRMQQWRNQPAEAWRQRSFRFLAGYSVALAAAQALSILLSLAHVVLSQPIAILIVAASIGAGERYAVRFRALPQEAAAQPRRPLVVGLAVAVIGMAGALYAASWVSALMKPDLSWDGNSYHIPMMHLWARRGYIHWIQFDYDPGPEWSWLFHWLFNGYPKGAETIDFLLVRALGTSLPVNTNNLVFMPLGVAGIAVAARSLGASPLASWTAGAALGLSPVIVGQGGTAYVDASLGACISAVVGCMSVALPDVRRGRIPWPVAPPLGSAMGLAAAAKSSGVAPAGLAVGLLVGVGAWAVWKTAPRGRRVLARTQIAFAGAVCGTAFAVAGYWYVRSWAYTGNPLSPVRVAIFGHLIFPGVALKDSISEEGLTPAFMQHWPSWKRIAFTWLQGGPHLSELAKEDIWTWAGTEHHWPCSIRWYDARDGGLGYLWALACAPSIVLVVGWAIRSAVRGGRDGPCWDVVLTLLTIVGVSFLVVPMNWWSRYTLWLYALGLPCVAVVIDRVARARLWSMKALGAAWLAACVAIASFESLYQFRYSALVGGFLALPWKVEYTPSGLWHALVWYDHPKYFYENMSALDTEVVTRSDAVALGSMEIVDGPLLGQLSMPLGLRDLVFVSREMADDEQRLRALLEKHQVRYIYWRYDEPTPVSILHLMRKEDSVNGYWRVYEVGPPAPTATGGIRVK